MKNPKHDELLDNFEEAKRKHLTYLASKMLKKQKLIDKLKTSKSTGKFLKDI